MMKASNIFAAFALAGLLLGSVVGCAGTPTQESAGEYIDDAAISTKVRAQLVGDKDLNILQIDVTTFKGVVQLSGFVDSPAVKARATTVAAAVPGVTEVRNNLIVK